MKIVLLFTVLMGSSISFGLPACPEATILTQVCESTPISTDDQYAIDVASDFAKSIAVCEDGKKTQLALEGQAIEQVISVKPTELANSTFYSAGHDGLQVHFVIAAKEGLEKIGSAVLSLTFLEAKAEYGDPVFSKTTYTCKKI